MNKLFLQTNIICNIILIDSISILSNNSLFNFLWWLFSFVYFIIFLLNPISEVKICQIIFLCILLSSLIVIFGSFNNPSICITVCVIMTSKFISPSYLTINDYPPNLSNKNSAPSGSLNPFLPQISMSIN